MIKIFLLTLIMLTASVGKSQCSIKLIDIAPDCGDNCTGSFLFKITGHKPITYTHIYGSATVSSSGPTSIDSFNVGTNLLCAGMQSFQMTDNLGCTVDTTVLIPSYANFEAGLEILSPNSSAGSCDGAVAPIAIQGGIEPLSFFYDEVVGSNPSALCSGEYYAIVRDSVGCIDMTPCISTEFLSSKENLINSFEITIQASMLKISQPYENLKIYNLSGQLVLESTTPEQNISIQELAAGPYVVSAFINGEVYNKKFIKTNP